MAMVAFKEVFLLYGSMYLATMVVCLVWPPESKYPQSFRSLWGNYFCSFVVQFLLHQVFEFFSWQRASQFLKPYLSVSFHLAINDTMSTVANYDSTVDIVKLGLGLEYASFIPSLINTICAFGSSARLYYDYSLPNNRNHMYPITPCLVVSGPYRYVRNPMTLVALVCNFIRPFFLLEGGSIRSILHLVLLVGILTAWFKYVEEPDLVKRFGIRYEAYHAHVPRWIPRTTAFKEPVHSENPNEGYMHIA